MPQHDHYGDLLVMDRSGNAYMIEDVHPVTLDDGTEITVCEKIYVEPEPGIEYSGRIHFPPEVRKKLSRKRYKKVLMSVGISRNAAEYLSREAVSTLPEPYRKMAIFPTGNKPWRQA